MARPLPAHASVQAHTLEGTLKQTLQDDPDSPSQRMEMRMTKELLRRLDDWRRQQRDIPSRSESVRRLVETALATGRARSTRAEAQGEQKAAERKSFRIVTFAPSADIAHRSAVGAWRRTRRRPPEKRGNMAASKSSVWNHRRPNRPTARSPAAKAGHRHRAHGHHSLRGVPTGGAPRSGCSRRPRHRYSTPRRIHRSAR